MFFYIAIITPQKFMRMTAFLKWSLLLHYVQDQYGKPKSFNSKITKFARIRPKYGRGKKIT